MESNCVNNSIKILIADDHPTFREGLQSLLKDQEGMQCVGIAADGEEAVRLTAELEPDVVVMDVAMPNLNGIEAAKQIKQHSPGVHILIVSAYDYPSYGLACLQVGASGYILKKAPLHELLECIQLIHKGDVVFSEDMISKIFCRVKTGSTNAEEGYESLKEREMQVLKLAAIGLSYKQIAANLGISDRTVQSHMFSIFRKLNINSRTEAVLRALKEGWLTLEELL